MCDLPPYFFKPEKYSKTPLHSTAVDCKLRTADCRAGSGIGGAVQEMYVDQYSKQ